MPRERQSATDAELAVLKLLWERGPLTARAIALALYSGCTESDMGSVHSLLLRLERKAMVARDRSSYVHVFSPRVTRSELAGQELEAIAQKLTDGSLSPFLTHIVQQKRLSRAEINELRELLAKYPRRS